jgi:hypothetical protein
LTASSTAKRILQHVLGRLFHYKLPFQTAICSHHVSITGKLAISNGKSACGK